MAQAGDFDIFPRARRVDKAVVADIKPDMGNPAAAQRAEKHHIPGLQFAPGNGGAHPRLFCRRARQVDAHRASEDVLHKAAAVETGGDRCAAVAVGDAQEPHRAADEFVGIARPPGGGLVDG